MKNILSATLLLIALSIPQISYADTCSLTKTLYDSGKFKRAYNLAKTHASNDACAEYYLGLMYLKGEGVKANTDKGMNLIHSSANKKYQPAIDFLTNMAP